MKITAKAKVTLELSIDLPGCWGETTTLDQVNKQAKEAMNGALQKLIGRMNTPDKENGDYSSIRVKYKTLDRNISLDLTEDKP